MYFVVVFSRHLEESGLAHEELASDLGRLLQEETDRVQEKRRRWDNGTRDRAGKEWVDFDLDNFHTHEEIGKYLHALEGSINCGFFLNCANTVP